MIMRPLTTHARPNNTGRQTKTALAQYAFTIRMGSPAHTPAIRVIVSKKTARTAVGRNTLRRRTREYIRKKIVNGMPKRDIIIFLHKGAADLTRENFYLELEHAMQRVMRNE